MKKRHISPEQEQEIVAEYKAKATTYQLAKKYKISRTKVSGILKRHGVR